MIDVRCCVAQSWQQSMVVELWTVCESEAVSAPIGSCCTVQICMLFLSFFTLLCLPLLKCFARWWQQCMGAGLGAVCESWAASALPEYLQPVSHQFSWCPHTERLHTKRHYCCQRNHQSSQYKRPSSICNLSHKWRTNKTQYLSYDSIVVWLFHSAWDFVLRMQHAQVSCGVVWSCISRLLMMR